MQRNDCVVEALRPPELLINGDFATDSDWIKGVGASISGGVLSWDGSSTSDTEGDTYQSVVTEVGEIYLATLDIIAVSGDVTFGFYDGAGGKSGPFTAPGKARYLYTSVRVVNSVALRISEGGTAIVDNATFRKVANSDYSDLLHQYYLNNGAASENISDAEYEFLIAQGATPAAIPDMWFELLGTLGYTGALPDRWKDFWCIGEGSLIP